MSHISNISDASDVGSSINTSASSGNHRSRVLELLEMNRKVARCDGLYRFVLWREALRGAAAASAKGGSTEAGRGRVTEREIQNRL